MFPKMLPLFAFYEFDDILNKYVLVLTLVTMYVACSSRGCSYATIQIL